MVKVKFLKKFKKYNMYVDNKNIYLMCKDEKEVKKDIKINDKKLLSDTLKLGEGINNTINLFYKEEIKNIRKKFILYDIDIEDTKKIKTHKEFIKYNDDLQTQNTNIINFIKDICYGINKTLDKEQDIGRKNDFFQLNLDIYNYNFFSSVYNNIYYFLKDNNVNIDNLDKPHDILSLINWENYGIEPSNNFINKNNKLEKPTTKKIKNYLKSQLNLLFELLDANKESINYTPIIKKINYIPLDIKNFFNYIMENNPNNKYTHHIYDEIIKYIEIYGVPFWTENIKIPKSLIDYNNIDISLNNLIFISLSIYVYTEIWKFFKKYSLIYDDIDSINFLNQSLNILNIDYIYGDNEKEIFEKIGESIKNLDIEIRYNYNNIFDYNLKIYRDRIWNDKQKTFSIEYSYENYIIGVWDIFFKYYFGNDNSFFKIEHNICIECNKEIIGKGHLKKTLCDDCFNKRQKELGRIRTQKCREKQKSTNN